jgi:hypothetical protein
LTLAVRELRDELRAMREVLCELSEAASWQNNNAEDYPALVGDRSALWTLAEMKFPKLIDELSGTPKPPTFDPEDREPKSQRDLF